MALFLELAYLRGNGNTIVVKELASVSSNGQQVFHFLPPYSQFLVKRKFQKANRFVVNKLHGIPWDYGNIPYYRLRSILHNLCSGYSVIYVKGPEKAKFVSGIIDRHVEDLAVLGCPKAETLSYYTTVKCSFQHNSCSLDKCNKYFRWHEWVKCNELDLTFEMDAFGLE